MGENADICGAIGQDVVTLNMGADLGVDPAPFVALGLNEITVASYWSNADNKCTTSDRRGPDLRCALPLHAEYEDFHTVDGEPWGSYEVVGPPTTSVAPAGLVDNYDKNPKLECSSSNGTAISTFGRTRGGAFPLGVTDITCQATDRSGNASEPCTTRFEFVDTLAPALFCPADTSFELQAPVAPLSYIRPGVRDGGDRAPTLVCNPELGRVVGPGVTHVSCSATDRSGNSAACGFAVTAVDATPPDVYCPVELQVEYLAGGVAVDLGATAVDAVDPAPSVSCVPASGSIFGLGLTEVVCSGRDASGNSAECIGSVNVADTIPPAITIIFPSPGTTYDVSVNAVLNTSALDAGTGVASLVTTIDGVEYMPGQALQMFDFGPGAHSLVVVAVDGAGNTATRTESFTVYASAGALAILVGQYASTLRGPWRGLEATLTAAQAAAAAGRTTAELNELGAFRNKLSALSGKAVDLAIASKLDAFAADLITRGG